MRRTGRTTRLIVDSIKQILETGETHFVDHPKGDDQGSLPFYPKPHYERIKNKMINTLDALLDGINPRQVWNFKVLNNGEGIKVTNIDGLKK